MALPWWQHHKHCRAYYYYYYYYYYWLFVSCSRLSPSTGLCWTQHPPTVADHHDTPAVTGGLHSAPIAGHRTEEPKNGWLHTAENTHQVWRTWFPLLRSGRLKHSATWLTWHYWHITYSRNDLKLFCLIVRTDLLLLLYGAPRRFAERRLTNLSLYSLFVFCIAINKLYHPVATAYEGGWWCTWISKMKTESKCKK